jgi:hypothetical protein
LPNTISFVNQLFFDPSTGTLYGIGGYYDTSTQQFLQTLAKIDPTTGAGVQVGSGVPLGGSSQQFAFDPNQHRLFFFGAPPGGPTNGPIPYLYSINTTSDTEVNPPPLVSVPDTVGGIGQLFFDPSTNTLYGIGGYYDQTTQQFLQTLVTLDPVTGAGVQVGSGVAVGGGVGLPAFDPNHHRLFFFASPPGSPTTGGTQNLYSVDTTNDTQIVNPAPLLSVPDTVGGVSHLFFDPGTSAPVVTAPTTAQSATAGTSTAISLGSFSDSGSGSSWSVDVDWGDGSAHTTFTVSAQGSLGAQSHTYATTSTYTVTVTVTNAASAAGSAQFPVFVTSTGAGVSDVSSGSSSSSSGTASASLGSGATTLSGDASGSGTLTVAQYSANPTSTPPPSAVNAYYDVYVSPGSSFTTTQVVDCNLAGGNVVYWWNGTAWAQVSPQSFDPSTGCVTLTLTSSSSPSVTQLSGTYFGVQKPAAGAKCALSSYAGANGVYDLRNANLSGCNLAKAQLAQAKGSDANLSLAYLGGANLSGATLTNTNLSGAGLFGVNFTNANLKNANLKGATLTGVVWQNTTCPDGTNSANDGGTCVGHF